MKLTVVKGVGTSAARKLAAAGIRSIDDLAKLDLRRQDVNGLSTEHLALLRENAQRFLAARERPSLTLVEGLGPSVRKKLEKAGISSIKDLAELDLRVQRISGLSTAHLQKLKRNARYLL